MGHNTDPYQRIINEEDLRQPRALREELIIRHVFDFKPYKSGMFPASDLPENMGEVTEMGLAWLRDNCHVANALWENGDSYSAARVGRAILDIFNSSRPLIDGVVSGNLDPSDHRNRPPVRVEGDTLKAGERPEVQNDSIGYSMWLTSRLIKAGVIDHKTEDLITLAQLTRYVEKIRYWEDADSGHWEEGMQVNASSIGTVIAGLKAVQDLFNHINLEENRLQIQKTIDVGRQRLAEILPSAVIEPPESTRRYDASLLFLVEPLDVLTPDQAIQVVNDITHNLLRKNGIARYPGDTYWGPNFRHQYQLGERATYAPGRLEERNRNAGYIATKDLEAQWTIFDPVLSVYWGKKYMATGDANARVAQLAHLNRSLQQLSPVGDYLKFPEAYFYEEGEWVPNDHIPLLWSQANLLLALNTFELTAVNS